MSSIESNHYHDAVPAKLERDKMRHLFMSLILGSVAAAWLPGDSTAKLTPRWRADSATWSNGAGV